MISVAIREPQEAATARNVQINHSLAISVIFKPFLRTSTLLLLKESTYAVQPVLTSDVILNAQEKEWHRLSVVDFGSQNSVTADLMRGCCLDHRLDLLQVN